MSSPGQPARILAPALRARRIALAVATAVLLAGLATWDQVARRGSTQERGHFERVVDQATLSLEQQTALYRNALLGLRAAFRASDELDAAEFARYVDALQVDRNLSGLRAFALNRDLAHAELPDYLERTRRQLLHLDGAYRGYAVHPPGTRERYHLVELIRPAIDNNRSLGYDLWSNETRRDTIARARSAGFAATPPIRLRQATDSTAVLMLAPVNAHGAQANGPERDTVAASFLVRDMLDAALSGDLRRQFHLRIVDTGLDSDPLPPPEALFEDALPDEDSVPAAGQPALRELNFGGRTWQLEFRPVHRPAALGESLALLLLTGSLSLLSGAVTYLGMQRRQRAARVAALAQLGSDCVFSLDPCGVVCEASGSAERITGLPRTAWRGRTLCAGALEADRERVAEAVGQALANGRPVMVEFRTREDGASSRWIAARIGNHLHDHRIGCVLVQISDIDARKQGEETIARMAFFDPLTNLPNRRLLDERARLTLGNAHRLGVQAAVLVLDLDGFKEVNDEAGHAVGDEVLKAVAARLSASVRENDTAARLGGDEFVVLLAASQHGEVEACAAAQRIAAALAAPVEAAGRSWRISASIGIALYPDNGATLDDLLRAADEAMYRIKHEGRDGYALAGQGPRARPR